MMAAKLHVHPSTINRELGRNTGLRGYRPKQAQQKALQRRFDACKAVSHERIYQHIWQDNRPRKSLGYLTPNEVFYEREKLTG